jgi:hypothetical protein
MCDVFKKIMGRNVSESEINRNENFVHYAHIAPVTFPAFEISVLTFFLGFAFRSPYCSIPANKPENLFPSRATG